MALFELGHFFLTSNFLFQVAQKLKVAMDKVKQKDLKIEMLEAERKRMALALEGNCQK